MSPKTRTVLIFVALLLIVGASYLWRDGTSDGGAGASAPPSSADGVAAIEEAFRSGRSDVWVEAGGVVERLLADDTQGSPHQRFILRIAPDRTLLISHNIDLAARVPIAVGDLVQFRGEYEWNERGGVVHWTHHDPAGRRRGGWIRHQGQSYD